MYDPNDKPSTSDPIPENECTAQITVAEIKDTQKGGSGLNLEWTLLDGPYAGRKCFEWINLKHTNPDVVKYGRADFAAVREGVFGTSTYNVKTPSELLYKPTRIKIGLKKNKDSGEMENVIRKYTYLGAGAPASQASTTVAGSTATTTATASKGGGW